MGFKKLKKVDQELEAYKNEPTTQSPNIGIGIDSGIDSGIDIPIGSSKRPNLPWENLNKNAVRPKKQFILKFNEYYHAALSHFSNQEEGVSMQKVVNEILTPALDKMIKEHEKSLE